jgi:hypothetical protein
MTGLVGLILVAVIAIHLKQGDVAAEPSDAAQVPTISPVVPMWPTLIAPVAAEPGEQLTLIAYQPGPSCGIGLELDGRAVVHWVTAIDSPRPGWEGIVITTRVPPTIQPGSHEFALVKSASAGRAGPQCANERPRVGRVSTATFIVTPPPVPVGKPREVGVQP